MADVNETLYLYPLCTVGPHEDPVLFMNIFPAHNSVEERLWRHPVQSSLQLYRLDHPLGAVLCFASGRR